MVDAQLRRIAFVTRAYGRLRNGILWTPVYPFALVLIQSVRAHDSSGALMWCLAGLSVGLPALWMIQRSMNRRFGRIVTEATAEVQRSWLPIAVAIAYGFVDRINEWAIR